MKFITYNSEAIALCLARPNWEENFTVEIDVTDVVNIEPGLSAQETRDKYAKSARFAFSFTVFTEDAGHSTALHLWLQRLKDQLIAVPMWQDGVEIYSDAAIGAAVINKTPDNPAHYGAEWIIVGPDFTTYEIVTVSSVDILHLNLATGTTLAWPAGTFAYPLLFGRPTTLPKFKGETDELLSGEIAFQENSTYARRINPYPGALPMVGASIAAFSTKPLWTIQPHWVDPISTIEADILWTRIGMGRQDKSYAKPQANRRSYEMGFLLDSRDHIAEFTRFFIDRFGPTKTFMWPTFEGLVRLTADVAAGAGTLQVGASDFTDAARPQNPGDPYIALVGPGVVDPQKVNSFTPTQLNLASTAAKHAMADTNVSPLVLGRLAQYKLTLTYTTDGLAEGKSKFIETPDEYANPQADRGERAYLFHYHEDLPNGTVIHSYFTSYEAGLVLSGGTGYDGNYVPGPFDHGDVTEGTDMEEENLEVSSFDFSSTANPLKKIHDFSLEGTLFLDLLEVDPNNLAAAPTVYFTGKAGKLTPKGKEWKIPFRAWGQYYGHQFPRYYVQRICNVPVYSPKCGANRADFLTDGTLYAIATDGSYIDIAVIGGHTDPASKPANYFSGPPGYFETGATVNYEQRTITATSIVSGKLRLFFAKPLRKAVPNQVVNIYPGCNGSIDMCISRFNNRVNFRGFPYTPDKDPSTSTGNVDVSTGGKK